MEWQNTNARVINVVFSVNEQGFLATQTRVKYFIMQRLCTLSGFVMRISLLFLRQTVLKELIPYLRAVFN